MITRIFIFLVGFGLTLIGFFYIITYLNLLTIGYNFIEYVNFITRRLECWYAIIGLIVLFLSICLDNGGKNELYLQYKPKL